MRRNLILVILLVASGAIAWAGEAPTTKPSEVEMLQTRVIEAHAVIERATAEALGNSKEFHAAQADLSSKELAMDLAKSSGTSRERVDAISAFNRAAKGLEQLKNQILSNNDAVKKAIKDENDAAGAIAALAEARDLGHLANKILTDINKVLLATQPTANATIVEKQKLQQDRDEKVEAIYAAAAGKTIRARLTIVDVLPAGKGGKKGTL